MSVWPQSLLKKGGQTFLKKIDSEQNLFAQIPIFKVNNPKNKQAEKHNILLK